MHNLKSVTIAAIAAIAILAQIGIAFAQQFPSKPLTIVVGFQPGGPADTMARAVAPVMAATLGQPVVVENRPGANGKIALQSVLRAPRDGHTIAYISSSIISIGPLVDKEVAEMQKDILPLTTAFRTSTAIAVHPSLKVKSLQDLVAYSKANPGKLFYGSIGGGSWYHFATEKLLGGLGIEATHVPYKGEAPGLIDLVGGNIQLMIVSAAGKGMLDEGKAVAIASSGSLPAEYAPNAKPVRQSGIPALTEYDEVPWIGFGMAKGAPDDVVAKLHAALTAALKSDDVRKRLAVFGTTETSTADELRRIIASEQTSYQRLIDTGRVKLEDK